MLLCRLHSLSFCVLEFVACLLQARGLFADNRRNSTARKDRNGQLQPNTAVERAGAAFGVVQAPVCGAASLGLQAQARVVLAFGDIYLLFGNLGSQFGVGYGQAASSGLLHPVMEPIGGGSSE